MTKRLSIHDEDKVLEARLLGMIRSGDPDAFDALYRAYYRRLRATTIHFLGYQDPEGEDVVQETFAVALDKLPRLKVRSSLYGWLNRICALLCFDRLRQRKRVLATDLVELLASAGPAQAPVEPLDAMVREQQRAALHLALEGLKPRCRRIIELRDLKGLSYTQVSLELKVPMGTVMSRLLRCRQALKQVLAKRGS